MTSSKDRYEGSRFLAGRFAAGKWRGTGPASIAEETRRLTLIGTSLKRLSIVGTSAERLTIVGTSR